MARKLPLPIFIGEFIDESPKRGRRTNVPNEHRLLSSRFFAVGEILERLLLGEKLKDVIDQIAIHRPFGVDQLRDLYRVNVRDAIYPVASNLVLLKKMTREEALSRAETILATLDKRSSAQKAKRKTKKSRLRKSSSDLSPL